MIRITKQADYGIVLLSYIAAEPSGRSWNARDLAQISHLPLPMVGKILKALVRKGLLVSHRGVKGGYNLARTPEAITVADIVAALDGPIAMTACAAHPGDCELESNCPSTSHWNRISLAIRSALEGITLAEMSRGGGVVRRREPLVALGGALSPNRDAESLNH